MERENWDELDLELIYGPDYSERYESFRPYRRQRYVRQPQQDNHVKDWTYLRYRKACPHLCLARYIKPKTKKLGRLVPGACLYSWGRHKCYGCGECSKDSRLKKLLAVCFELRKG